MIERREGGGIVATVNEAAFVAGVSRQAVNQAIDRGEIHSWILRRETDVPGRAVGAPELIYLRVYLFLSPRARKAVYQELSGTSIEAMPRRIVFEGGGRLDLEDVVSSVQEKLTELDRIKNNIEENPGIRGGEAVFRGTRIPVHMIADFLKQEIPRDEILEDYPALAPESLDIALRYTELYPRKGRPRQAPWHAQDPTHVFRPEDLRGGGR
jgi:uncharacterized protein (DUF433 family)